MRPKYARLASKFSTSTARNNTHFVCFDFRTISARKVAGLIDPHVCETDGIGSSESSPDADEGVHHETEAKLERGCNYYKRIASAIAVFRKANSLRCYLHLCLDVKRVQHTRFIVAPLVKNGKHPLEFSESPNLKRFRSYAINTGRDICPLRLFSAFSTFMLLRMMIKEHSATRSTSKPPLSSMCKTCLDWNGHRPSEPTGFAPRLVWRDCHDNESVYG